MSILRTFLILGRVSNLPTVWSNCLAGWWLGGGGEVGNLPFLFIGATLLYLGGMFLNDACDAEFDRQHRRERPIPSGAIRPQTVWRWGSAWLALGTLALVWPGKVTAGLGVVLVVSIVLYDVVHKQTAVSPLLLGLCRFLLYVIAASTAAKGVTGSSLWCGLALAAWIVGLSYLARRESPGLESGLRYWPVLLLAAPIVLAVLMNANAPREGALLLSAILALWGVKCIGASLWSPEPNLRATVSGLLAGVVLVDWLAVGPALPHELSFVFIGLFLAALLFQRFVPAT